VKDQTGDLVKTFYCARPDAARPGLILSEAIDGTLTPIGQFGLSEGIWYTLDATGATLTKPCPLPAMPGVISSSRSRRA
jgi:hypothetical protein